jgi:hypothetical protein
MNRKKAARLPGSRASGPDQAQSQREQAADKRQSRADERERLANQRERVADDRETAADERERAADEREGESDQREVALTERQQKADEREHKLDKRALAVGLAAASMRQRTLEDIERSRALLAEGVQRLDRQEAAVKRADKGQEREQAQIDRASGEGTRRLAVQRPDPSQSVERAKALRGRSIAMIAAFAASEEEIALVHEEMAARDPTHREEYRRTAARAREAARRALEILETFPR